MELKRLAENEDDDKKKKNIALKVTKTEYTKSKNEDFHSESDKDMDPMF